MAESIFDAMGDVLTRWTMGSAAAPAAPMWKEQLGADPGEAELRLLALSGHFLGTTLAAEPPSGLRALPDIPKLELPTVPEFVRPLVRRIMNEQTFDLLQFLAARGWTVHPADWMPAANEEVSDIYAPWRKWAEIAASTNHVEPAPSDAITAENWNYVQPVAREIAWKKLRQSDAAAARVLLDAKFAGEKADQRLSLLWMLESGLSESDIPFLEKVAGGDRAPKVKAFAASLLVRLAPATVIREDAAELKEFFSTKTKGLLRRRRVIHFENVQTPAQSTRRAELLDDVDIVAFGAVLGMTASALIAAWQWDQDSDADIGFIEMIARSATDTLVLEAADVVRASANARHRLLDLAPRLPPARLTSVAELILALGENFQTTNAVAEGGLRAENPLATPAGRELLKCLRIADAKFQTLELRALGFITARASVRGVLEQFSAVGVVQEHPNLDALRLNEALEDRIGSEGGAKP